MLRPAKIALEALNVAPAGADIAEQDTCCVLCGFPIKKGEKCQFNAMKGKPNFMDDLDLAYRDSQIACQWCQPVMTKKVMSKVIATVFTKKGAYSILKDIHRTWFLLTPPKPPYLIVVNSTTNSQHLIWRTPITLDNEMITLRYGNKLLTIRHSKLMEAFRLCTEAGDILQEFKNNKTPYSHPFLSLDRNLKSLNHGKFNPSAINIANSNHRMEEILIALSKSSLGELWALASLAKRNKSEPIQPDFIEM